MTIHTATRIAVLAASLLFWLGLGQSQDPTSPASVPQRLRVSSGLMTGLRIKAVPPVYPAEAREQHIQGVVLMQAIISKEGEVADLQLISGDPLLAKSAMKAVKKWKYKPFLRNGESVEVETQIQVNFTLTDPR